MENLRVRVINGKIIGDAPAGIPEGTEFEVRLAEPEDAMAEAEVAELNRALEIAWRSVEAGRVRIAADVVRGLRSK
jgi:hypothetical protein